MLHGCEDQPYVVTITEFLNIVVVELCVIVSY